jgi:hypothetical protein
VELVGDAVIGAIAGALAAGGCEGVVAGAIATGALVVVGGLASSMTGRTSGPRDVLRAPLAAGVELVPPAPFG